MSVNASTPVPVAPTAPSRAAKAAASAASEAFGSMVSDVMVSEHSKAVAPPVEPAAGTASAGSSNREKTPDDPVEDKDAGTGNGALLTGTALFLAQPQPLSPTGETSAPASDAITANGSPKAGPDKMGPDRTGPEMTGMKALLAANAPAPEDANGTPAPSVSSAMDLTQPALASAAAAGTAEGVASALGKGAEAPNADATIAAVTAQAASEPKTGKDSNAAPPPSAPSVSTADVLTAGAPRLAAGKSGETSNAAASSTKTENGTFAQAGETSGAVAGAKAVAQTTGAAVVDAQHSAAAASSTTTSAFAAQMQAQAQAAEPAVAATTDTAPTAQNQPAAHVASTQTTPVIASFSGLSRATLETTVQIAAQITRQLAGRSTRFEMGLTPEGLGKVNVSMDIDADGQLTARLAFDNPLAAADLRARADELRGQLQDAGFKLADDALTFSQQDTASRDGGGADQSPGQNQSRAFAAASPLANDVDVTPIVPAWVSLSLTPRGVDMKV